MNALPFELMCKTGEPLMQFKGCALITPVSLHCCYKDIKTAVVMH
jgi:hypothetical protein